MVVVMELMRVKLSEVSWACLSGMEYLEYLDLKKGILLKAMHSDLLMANYLVAR